MTEALTEALQFGLDAAEHVLADRKQALAGYPHKWRIEQEAVDTIRAALERVTQPVAPGWQTMETAPKDGSMVLLFGSWFGEVHGEVESPGIYVGWYEGCDFAPVGYAWSVEGGDAYATWCRPTHWMPLPNAPTPPQESKPA